jgi:hypothetical protein
MLSAGFVCAIIYSDIFTAFMDYSSQAPLSSTSILDEKYFPTNKPVNLEIYDFFQPLTYFGKVEPYLCGEIYKVER